MTTPIISTAEHAKTLKALHKPGEPIVFANVWDISSLNAVLSLDSTSTPVTDRLVKAVATASYAIAEALGTYDDALTFEQNVDAVAHLAPIVQAAGLPLTADLQDGYGPRLAECVRRAVELGIAGANIEDAVPGRGVEGSVEHCLYPLDEQVTRLRAAIGAAAEAGAPDFVLNARTDVMALVPRPEGALEEAVRRGKAFLEAGATTVFVWGRTNGLSQADVEVLVREFDGRLAVKLAENKGALTVNELARIGVARISVGPSIWKAAMATVRAVASDILQGGGLSS